MCCSVRKVSLPPLLPPPQLLLNILTVNTYESLRFRKHIRKYNSAFQMTSFGADRKLFEQGFMPTIKIQGQVYHCIGPFPYTALRDAVETDGEVSNVSQLVVLPSSFTGGPRYMHEKCQDAMTYVKHHAAPD